MANDLVGLIGLAGLVDKIEDVAVETAKIGVIEVNSVHFVFDEAKGALVQLRGHQKQG